MKLSQVASGGHYLMAPDAELVQVLSLDRWSRGPQRSRPEEAILSNGAVVLLPLNCWPDFGQGNCLLVRRADGRLDLVEWGLLEPRPCPTPKKLAFTSQEEAINAALRKSRRFGAGQRPYRCVCGAWHLSTKNWSLRGRNWAGAKPAQVN